MAPEDQAEYLAAVSRSRKLHAPWVHPPGTPRQFAGYVERLAAPANRGFVVCQRSTGRMAGIIEISNIVMGIFRSGYLGYYAFAGFERQGLMREGLLAVVRQAFGTLHMHRLEANIQPGNAPSLALVKSCGFTCEGFSPRYLKIRGRWRDHERWAIVAD